LTVLHVTLSQADGDTNECALHDSPAAAGQLTTAHKHDTHGRVLHDSQNQLCLVDGLSTTLQRGVLVCKHQSDDTL